MSIISTVSFSVWAHHVKADEADAEILTAYPTEEWKRPPGRPQTTWMKTVLDDVKSYKLTLTEIVNVVYVGNSGCEWCCALLEPEMMMMMTMHNKRLFCAASIIDHRLGK